MVKIESEGVSLIFSPSAYPDPLGWYAQNVRAIFYAFGRPFHLCRDEIGGHTVLDQGFKTVIVLPMLDPWGPAMASFSLHLSPENDQSHPPRC
jgi:hypothetical protein